MIDAYRAYLVSQGKAAHTVTAYCRDVTAFLGDLHCRPEDPITPVDVRKWIGQAVQAPTGQPLKVTTINRHLNALRSFYAWATLRGAVCDNPLAPIRDVKTADATPETIQWLTEEEFADLLDRLRQSSKTRHHSEAEAKYRRDRAVIYLLTYAGLRVQELSQLTLRDIDSDLHRLRVVGKGQKVRTIPIARLLGYEIDDWLTFRTIQAQTHRMIAESPYVFYSQRSPQFSVRGIQAMIAGYSTATKTLTPHMFRHTFCKWMLKATHNDLEKVRRLAGHRHIETTARYLRDAFSDLADAVDALPPL